MEVKVRLNTKRATFLVAKNKNTDAMQVLAKDNAMAFSYMTREERVEKKTFGNTDLSFKQ